MSAKARRGNEVDTVDTMKASEMSTSETFEVSLVNTTSDHTMIYPMLYSVSSTHTFQKLFDEIFQKTQNNRGRRNSNDSNLSSDCNDDIKTLICQCSSDHFRSHCNVQLSMNICSIARRHGFTSIRYQVTFPDNPSKSLSESLSDHNRNGNAVVSQLLSPKSSASNQVSKRSNVDKYVSKSRKNKSGSFIVPNSVMDTRRRYKIFRHRESMLSALLHIPEITSLYYIFLAGFGIFFLSTLIDDYTKSGFVFNSLEMFKWNFGAWREVMNFWVYMFFYAYIPSGIVYCWRNNLYIFSVAKKLQDQKVKRSRRKSSTHLSNAQYPNILFWTCYALYLLPLLYYPFMRATDLPCASSMIITCEQVRIIMKSHSFIVECWRTYTWSCAKEREAEEKKLTEYQTFESQTSMQKLDPSLQDTPDNTHLKEHLEEKESPSEEIPPTKPMTSIATPASAVLPSPPPEIVPPYLVELDMEPTDFLEKYTYFLFVPTLVYRTSYPRTKTMSLTRAFRFFMDICLSLVSTWTLFCRFCIPVYRKTIKEPGDLPALLSSTVNASLPGMMLLLVGFFGVLHCWMNMWAELLRFADRQFYQDWWNSRSFAQYYRKWNCVVHDWIYNYMYLPVLELGYNKQIAMLIVFVISAIIHEYVLFVAMKFFYPVLLLMFGGIGVLFIPLTSMWKNARGWNVFLWSNLLIGQGILVVLYSREWFAQHDPEAQQFLDPNSWMPKSWQLLFLQN